MVGRGLENPALRDQSDPEAPGAAGAVLSFRAVIARNLGLHRLLGILHATDGGVLGSCARSHFIPKASQRTRRARHFVKNNIAQSQEFALCALALAFPIFSLLRTKRVWQALLLGAISLGFIANMAFVIVSRTAMVTMPIMLVVFAVLHLKWRTSLLIFGALAIMAGLAGTNSPQLQRTMDTFFTDYQRHKTENIATSIGLRLEFWKNSLRFFAEAPVIGHGTGSILGLFEKAATGDTHSATRQVIGNPHNQTLNVAVQWGMVGVVLLYAMWLMHLLLFRGEGLVAWIGLLVVVQNIFTSLFNSHIFDFHEGWMYVLGVGVAGGMVLKARSAGSVGEPTEIRRS